MGPVWFQELKDTRDCIIWYFIIKYVVVLLSSNPVPLKYQAESLPLNYGRLHTIYNINKIFYQNKRFRFMKLLSMLQLMHQCVHVLITIQIHTCWYNKRNNSWCIICLHAVYTVCVLFVDCIQGYRDKGQCVLS